LFPPECFATLRCSETGRRKQFDKGISQLVEEGAIQLLRDLGGTSTEPVLAAVGQLQFEVVQYRLEAEYNAKTTLHRMPYRMARWITGDPADIEEMRVPSMGRLLQDQDGSPVVLFESEGMLRYCLELNPKLTFSDVRPVKSNR
jgi:peptide chain release factor 3